MYRKVKEESISVFIDVNPHTVHTGKYLKHVLSCQIKEKNLKKNLFKYCNW